MVMRSEIPQAQELDNGSGSAETVPSGEEIPPTPEKSAAMFDVHAPHGPVHTWKGFWIHLGTISIGLLIALGLEQAVVSLDHLHERDRLEQDLQLEAKKNLILIDIDKTYFDAMLPWLLQLRGDVNALRESGATSKFVYPPPPKALSIWFPDAPYWNSAKESAEVRLLPRDEAGMYDLVYAQQKFMMERGLSYGDALFQMKQFLARFSNLEGDESTAHMSQMTAAQRNRAVLANFSKGMLVPIASKMSPEDLREWYGLLNDAVAQLIRFRTVTDVAYSVTQAVIHGAKSDEQLFKMMGARPGEEPEAAPEAAAKK